VLSCSAVTLFDAVEAGVPTYVIDVMAGAMSLAPSCVLEVLGVSATTYRRRDCAKRPLPDLAGHRAMGVLRTAAAALRQLLEESGDDGAVKMFDLSKWFGAWLHESLPELGGRSPAEMLRNAEGVHALEAVFHRMRGGLPA
jgi:uncharacterized protein (DUF2384 family)